MSKVKITKNQAEFIETFKGDKIKAVHYISRWGWGHFLTDGEGNKYEYEDLKPFEQDEKLIIISAVIEGYEVKEKNVLLYMDFYDFGYEYKRKLYYGDEGHVTNKLNASEYDLNIELEKEIVEKRKKQGWEVEEV